MVSRGMKAMAVDDIELVALTTARDVLQKQIDERVALWRQEMLLANIKGKVDDWRC